MTNWQQIALQDIPGPFAPPLRMRPSLKMMARSYSLIIWNRLLDVTQGFPEVTWWIPNFAHTRLGQSIWVSNLTHISVLAAFENFSLNFIVKKQRVKEKNRDNIPQEILTGWHLGRPRHQQQPWGVSWQQHNKVQHLWPSRNFSSSNSDATSAKPGGKNSSCPESANINFRVITDNTVSSNVSHAATSMHIIPDFYYIYIITDFYLHTSYLDVWYTGRDLLKKSSISSLRVVMGSCNYSDPSNEFIY